MGTLESTTLALSTGWGTTTTPRALRLPERPSTTLTLESTTLALESTTLALESTTLALSTGWGTTTTPRALRLPELESTTLTLETGWGTITPPRALRLRVRLSIRIHFRLCPTCRRTTRLSWRAAVLLEVEGCL